MTDEQHSEWQRDLAEMETLLVTLDHILESSTLQDRHIGITDNSVSRSK